MTPMVVAAPISSMPPASRMPQRSSSLLRSSTTRGSSPSSVPFMRILRIIGTRSVPPASDERLHSGLGQHGEGLLEAGRPHVGLELHLASSTSSGSPAAAVSAMRSAAFWMARTMPL